MTILTTKTDVYQAMIEHVNTFNGGIPYLCPLMAKVAHNNTIDPDIVAEIYQDINTVLRTTGRFGTLALPPHIEALVDRHGEAAPALDSAYRLGVLYQLLANAETAP